MKVKNWYTININKRISFLFLLTSLLIVSVSFFAENGYLNAFFAKVGVYPVSENYTALFFADSEQLSNLDEHSDAIEFSFGVLNREGEDLVYDYVVKVVTDTDFIILDEGIISVSSKETVYHKTVVDRAVFKKGSDVYVVLPSYNKTISFEI